MIRNDDDKSKLVRQLSLLGVIPILLAVGPLVGMLIGSLLDNWLGTDPFLKILFIVMGFVASGKEIYKLIKRVEKDS